MPPYGFDTIPQPQNWFVYGSGALYIVLLVGIYKATVVANGSYRSILAGISCAWLATSFAGVLGYVANFFVYEEPTSILFLASISSVLLLVAVGLVKLGSLIIRTMALPYRDDNSPNGS